MAWKYGRKRNWKKYALGIVALLAVFYFITAFGVPVTTFSNSAIPFEPCTDSIFVLSCSLRSPPQSFTVNERVELVARDDPYFFRLRYNTPFARGLYYRYLQEKYSISAEMTDDTGSGLHLRTEDSSTRAQLTGIGFSETCDQRWTYNDAACGFSPGYCASFSVVPPRCCLSTRHLENYNCLYVKNWNIGEKQEILNNAECRFVGAFEGESQTTWSGVVQTKGEYLYCIMPHSGSDTVASGSLIIDFNRPFVECIPNWQCSSWGTCIDETQTRSCTDLNGCMTMKEKPTETQTCAPAECAPRETKIHICADTGINVPWCSCENEEWACIISPETGCPGVTPPVIPPVVQPGQDMSTIYIVILIIVVMMAIVVLVLKRK